ncbi:ABC transporter G family member 21-like isoform X2 [Mizuhopecten yessoensis]|uniref:ABC transporter G family member 21-like isoform X2 n=1 Tax=Mizuhopecten yessoensis TaxID=6573 RepID=UPI000B459B74|nr:ABC transporter G family member 21-like isoform X2 [Mizuhopecten yessoensis]
MEKVSKSSKLEFKDVMVSTKSKVLLKNVSGSASSGDLLAVMGPTGAGKTTFLNILAGRVSGDTGTITLNGSPLNKTQRRRLGYVSQDDIFLSNLTLWETLYFTAMIRIPDQVSQQEKTEKIYSVVDSLGLKKCLHTPIGDIFCRGISGGEKKRANIACELLTDPDILLIDEPTSGLDSSTAHTLMVQLKNYATEYNKTIVATIHQPSSQVFHMFSTLLLLVEGEVAYFGLANMVKEYFASLGMTCSQYYNPADFLMDILTKDTIRNMKEEDIRNIQSLQLPTGRLDGRSATESDKEGGTGPAGLPLTLVTGERAVVSKDRSAGAYRLSAYYLAKITSEMPLLLCVPLLFNTAVYWLAGLGGVDGYFVYIGIGILNCLMIQSLAHNLGVLIKDVRLSMMAGNVIIIDGLLLGGFLNINPPEWLLWVKYLTFTHYPYSAVMTYLLKDMTDVWCNQTSTDIFPQCLGNMNEALTSRDILIGIGVDLPIYCYIMTIVFAVLIFYVLGYYLLKWKRV